MPPFQYASAPNPYAMSLADVLARRGDIAANAATQIGNVQANAALQSGRAWGGAIQAIGQIPDELQQAKARDIQIKSQQMALQHAQAAQALGGLITNSIEQTPDGHSVYNTDKFLSQVKAHPELAAFAHEPLDAMTKANESLQQFLEGRYATKDAVLKGIYAKAAEAGGAPDDYKTAGMIAIQNHMATEADLAPVYQRLAALPDQTARVTFLNALAGVRPTITVVHEGDTALQFTHGLPQPEVVAQGQPKPVTAEQATIDAYTGSLGKPAGTKWADLTPQEQAGLPKWKAQIESDTEPITVKTMVNGKPVERVMTKAEALKQGVFPSQPPASMTINPSLVPSGDALSMAARRYLATGELPAMGMGNAGAAARVAVMNEAARIDPQASLAQNKATYKADTTNLTNLQKTEGTLSAFESTAGKNLDQFLTLASKIPDTGVPWLNTPVRLLNQQVVGSANMAAINAARDVALREIARVTNDPKLAGALTDSARAEVLGLSPKDATLPQIRAVARVLKQDMANVHAGLKAQIDQVKSGIGGNPAAAPTGTIRAKDPQGNIHEAPAGTALPAGWVLQ